LVGHVYSLVPIAVVYHRLSRQIVAWQLWFRRNKHFAFCLCIKGVVHCICHWCHA